MSRKGVIPAADLATERAVVRGFEDIHSAAVKLASATKDEKDRAALIAEAYEHRLYSLLNYRRRRVEADFDAVHENRKATDDEKRTSMTRLARQTVFLPSGAIVTYGSMTVEQHEERAEYYSNVIAGNRKAMQRHRLAIKVIEAAGVACLDDAGVLFTELVPA